MRFILSQLWFDHRNRNEFVCKRSRTKNVSVQRVIQTHDQSCAITEYVLDILLYRKLQDARVHSLFYLLCRLLCVTWTLLRYDRNSAARKKKKKKKQYKKKVLRSGDPVKDDRTPSFSCTAKQNSGETNLILTRYFLKQSAEWRRIRRSVFVCFCFFDFVE